MQDREEMNQDPEVLSGEVMDSLGVNDKEAKQEGTAELPTQKDDDLPKPLKERLGRQEKRHKREMREMQARMESMQAQMQQSHQTAPPVNQSQPQQMDYQSNPAGNVNDIVQHAVNAALREREMREQKAQDAERQAHVNRQYQALKDHLDHHADKYEDFDDVVHGSDVPFTAAMRDAALVLPRSGSGSAAEVLYKLGKNRPELERISKLHPLDQAAEMVKLSHVLMSGNERHTSSHNPMGSIKTNPAVNNPSSITETTPISELRRRLKTGRQR